MLYLMFITIFVHDSTRTTYINIQISTLERHLKRQHSSLKMGNPHTELLIHLSM